MARGSERSFCAFWLGGAAKPPKVSERIGVRDLLAFWIGGACAPAFIPSPLPAGVAGEGIPFDRHIGRRPPIDDEEILEFLQTWVTWQDIE